MLAIRLWYVRRLQSEMERNTEQLMRYTEEKSTSAYLSCRRTSCRPLKQICYEEGLGEDAQATE